MNKLFSVVLSAAAAASVLFAAGSAPAKAQSVTFAQFIQGATGNPFVFTNSGSNSTFNAGPTGVTFTYLEPNSYGATNTTINATMTMTSVVSGAAVNDGGIVTQGLNNIDVTFTALTPVNGKSNLLSLNLANGTLAGINGGNTAVLSGSTSAGNTVAYSSDFLSFGSQNNYSFPFTVKFSTPYQIGENGYLNSFRASGTGTFDTSTTTAAVPETSSLLTVGLMVLGTGLLCVARRRSSQTGCASA